MKKILGELIFAALMLMAVCAGADVALDEVHFPDETFRKIISGRDVNADGFLNDEEIASATMLDLLGEEIRSLKGLEYLTSLESLWCKNVQATEIDLSENKALNRLQCIDMPLKTLILKENQQLISMECTGCNLETIDVTGASQICDLIQTRECYFNSYSNTHCWSDYNTHRYLQIDPETAVIAADYVSQPYYAELTQNNFPDDIFRAYLQSESVDRNQDGKLGREEKLTALRVGNMGIQSLKGIEQLKDLVTLECYTNNLKELDVSGNPRLKSLSCQNNQIRKLILGHNSVLETLNCGTNAIEELDVSGCPVLMKYVRENERAQGDNFGQFGGQFTFDSFTVIIAEDLISVMEIRAENGIYRLIGENAVFNGPVDKDAKKLKILGKVSAYGKDYTVTEIRERACAQMSNLTSLDIDEEIQTIDARAFAGLAKLSSITGMEGVHEIKESAFSGCSGLKKVKLGSQTTSLGTYCFGWCTSLKEVILDDALTSIGEEAFYQCEKLKEVILPPNITEYNGAFAWDCKLYCKMGDKTALTLGKKGRHFFLEGTETKLIYVDGKKNQLKLLDMDREAETASVPEGVNLTYDSVFNNCRNLKWVELPASIRSLGDTSFSSKDWQFYVKVKPGSYAERFARSHGLQYDNGKKKVIGWKITSLTEKVNWIVSNYITGGMSEKEKARVLFYWLVNNAKYDYTYTEYAAEGVLLKGTGVCNSYSRAYEMLLNKAGIANKWIDGKVTRDGEGHAWNLVRVDGQWYHADPTWGVEYFLVSDSYMKKSRIWNESISADKNQVGSYNRNGEEFCYTECGVFRLNMAKGTATLTVGKNIKKAEIPEKVSFDGKNYKVTAIGEEAFRNCGKLTTVIIPKGVESIGKGAFQGCGKLTKITIRAVKMTSVGAEAFDGIGSKATVTCPAKMLKKYRKMITKAGAGEKVSFKK